jgi:hypothetical protein
MEDVMSDDVAVWTPGENGEPGVSRYDAIDKPFRGRVKFPDRKWGPWKEGYLCRPCDVVGGWRSICERCGREIDILDDRVSYRSDKNSTAAETQEL